MQIAQKNLENILLTISGAHDFTAGMHRQLGHASIHGADPCACTNDRTNSGTARAIISYTKLLDGQVTYAGQLSKDKPSDTIRGVSLIGIGLDDQPSIHFRRVLGLVLGGVVWMNGMGLINGKTE